MKALYKTRLLNVAKALRESKTPKDFTMETVQNECGTPGCALGHYASRTDLQKLLRLGTNDGPSLLVRGKPCWFDDDTVLAHFGLDCCEFDELFGAFGCDEAKTPVAAAEYIEKFVKRKEREADE